MSGMKAQEIKGKSPYAKYLKRPFVYSPLFQQWRSARMAGNEAESKRLGDKHREQWLGEFIREEIRAGRRAPQKGDRSFFEGNLAA